jgi:thiol-disulfide isomerase/thioredoxin
MVRVEVYGKPDCPLCDDAKGVLRAVQDELPFELVDVDVSRDAAANARWGAEVPVVFVDGAPAFRHRVDPAAAKARIGRAVADREGLAPDAPRLDGRGARLAKLALLAACALAAAGVLAAKGYDTWVAQPRAAEDAYEIVRVDKPAPELALAGPDGKTFSLSQFRGEVLFVNFWATWCPPCREEMPSMLALGRALAASRPGKFRMIAISGDDGWGVIQDYFRTGFGGVPKELTLALDQNGQAAQAYYCTARGFCPDIKFPETYIVDKSGRLVAYIVAGRDWSEPVARRFLEKLIDG